jgi:hypothetical protein
MFNNSTISSFYAKSRKATIIFLTAVGLSLQTACKDDDNKIAPDGLNNDPTAVIPAKDKKFNYKIIGNDGSTYNEVTQVKSIRDSAGIAVSHLETSTTDGQEVSVMKWKAYSQNGVTTNEIPLPTALTGLLAQMQEIGTVKDFRITGFPQYQNRENKAVVGSTITFNGDNIKIYVKLEVPNNEGAPFIVELESTLTYIGGKITKVENLTTPAGAFNCSKWEYGYSYVNKVKYNGQAGDQTTENYTVTDWTVPGVGIVKSVEKTTDTESVTELQKID